MDDQRRTVLEALVPFVAVSVERIQSGTISGYLDADNIIILASFRLYVRTTPHSNVSAMHSMTGNQGNVWSVISVVASSSNVNDILSFCSKSSWCCAEDVVL